MAPCREDPERRVFGLIPFMARFTKYQIGAVNAESYCERVLSAGNHIMPTGRTLLSSSNLEKMTMIRMNADFIAHVRAHPIFGPKLKEKFGKTVVQV